MEEGIEKRKSKISKFLFGWVKDNYDRIFLAILLAAFALRLYIFFQTMHQPLWWDEADYLSAGKRWGLSLDIRDIWYYRRGFLFPLISALFFKTGLGETGIRFLEVLFSTGIVAVSYALISKMFSKKLALLTSIALSASWIILFFTGRILTDIPAAFFLLLALLLFWKGYVLKEGNKFLYLFGFIFVCAVMTRMQSLMLAPPFLIYIFIKEKFKMFKNKQLWITLGIFLLLLVPYLIIYSTHYGNPIADLASHYLGIGSSAHPVSSGNVRTFSMATFNYFKDLPYMVTTPILILLIIGAIYFLNDLIIGLDKVRKDEILSNKLFVVLWILSLFLIMGYIGSVSYVEQRYVTAALPFLFMIAVSPLILFEKIISKYLKINKRLIFVGLFVILIAMMIPNFTLTKNLTENKLYSYYSIEQAGKLIKADSNSTDIIMSTSLPQITYYSERSVYPYEVHEDGINKGDNSLLKYSEGEKGFEEFLTDKKPKYLMTSSIFEDYPTWILTQGQKEGYNFIVMPFFNSSIVYDAKTNQMVSLDLKGEIKKENMTLTLFFPKSVDEINGVFIYKVEYNN
ncbi:Dolichyl-phosphate-mannose-protein mannosyltransferase [uncultured archaeon]|nr:Dolichyl-phosphate-mannose-protein mannosyltransferase [uncultured archaeon]